MELTPTVARAYEANNELARSLHAVPQPDQLKVELQDGRMRFLTRYIYQPFTQANEIRLLRLHPPSINPFVLPSCELVFTY